MPGKSGTGPESIDRRERMAKALRLRHGGASYRQIAKQLGVSIATAHTYVREALAEVTKEPAEELLQLELDRLDGMWLGISAKAFRGDLKAIDRGLRISQRRSALTGLDALAVMRIRGEGRELSAVDAFHEAILGEKADDDLDVGEDEQP